MKQGKMVEIHLYAI